MVPASITSMSLVHLLFLFPMSLANDLIVLVMGGAYAFLLTYIFTFGIIGFCRRVGWLDKPEARRIHKNPVPRLGGIAMFLGFVLASMVFYAPDPIVQSKEMITYWLLLVASLLIVLVHAYDDVKGLKPLTKLLAQTAAVIILLGPGWTVVKGVVTYVFHGVLLFGFSNPFGAPNSTHSLPWYRQPEITLFIQHPDITVAAIPAVLFTWFWMAGMMNTVNLIDGLDGLATGVVGITGLFITIISWTLGQHSIAILSAIFTGAVFGFLPHNWSPAKVFMGDSGSQFLGLGLAVLSIIGGAKVALALMVLGIPILDVAVVMINRVRRGQHPLYYDRTHLHYRLLATGLRVKQICYLFYGLTLIFGILGLSLNHYLKLIGMGLVGLTMAALIYWIDHRQQKSGELIKLGPDPEPPGGMGSSLGPTDDGRHCTPSEWELGKDISHSALNEDERFVSGQPGGAKAQTNNLMEAVRV
jgi:UDP-GlcNAc:undecaprenyl-phosphate/decaprenyl-phosphate GlcNAc-1-phosphate transferase